MAHDLREVLRVAAEKPAQPSAVILDGRTLQSTPESGHRAGYDGYKRRKDSKVHVAVDTLGHLLALKVTPANAPERAQVGELARAVQEVTGEKVEVAFVDQGYTGAEPKAQAARAGVRLIVVKLEEARKGLSCCPDAGSWSAPLPGPPAFVVWPAIMNACPPTSPAFTGWLFLLSCLTLSFIKVHDTL